MTAAVKFMVEGGPLVIVNGAIAGAPAEPSDCLTEFMRRMPPDTLPRVLSYEPFTPVYLCPEQDNAP